MELKDTILAKDHENTYASIDGGLENNLCLYDPITQICKRIEAFFNRDKDIHCAFVVNNNKRLGPKLHPDTGEQMTHLIIIDGESVEALVEEDHLCEFRIFCDDYEKAQNLANVIRHRHTFTETYDGSDGRVHVRDHILLVRVFTISAVDPDGPGGGDNPWIADDNTDSGLTEIFGLEPIDWDDPEGNGCEERLAPSDTSESDIPKGAPEEYEQRQWEANSRSGACAWKWKWLKKALTGNKNVISFSKEFDDGMNIWRFIECTYLPITFQEDNLTSMKGYNSILAADLLPLVFSVFGKFQISTYPVKE